MPEFPDALRSADEEIGQRAEHLQHHDDDDPDDFGVANGGFIFHATDESGNPKNRAQEEKEQDENPLGTMRQPDGKNGMGEDGMHNSINSR